MTREQIIKELKAEAARIEEDSEVSYKSKYNNAEIYETKHKNLLRATIFFSSLAAICSTQDLELLGLLPLVQIPIIRIILFVSPLLAIYCTERAKTKEYQKLANEHKNYGYEYQKLRDDTRIFKNIELLDDNKSDQELKSILISLSSRLNELRKKSPRHSNKAYKKSIKGISKGETSYKVDAKVSTGSSV